MRADPRGVVGQPAAVVDQADVLGLDRVGQRGDDLSGTLEARDRATQAHRAAHARQQLGLLDGLRQEVVGTGVEGGDHVVDRGVRGDHDHRQRRGQRIGAQPAADLEAVDARQVQVEQHQLRRVLDDRAQADLAVGQRRCTLVALALEDACQQVALCRLVLDDSTSGRESK